MDFIAALNGAEVVMSTPASFRRSIGYFDDPEESIFRYASRVVVEEPSERIFAAMREEAVMLVAYW